MRSTSTRSRVHIYSLSPVHHKSRCTRDLTPDALSRPSANRHHRARLDRSHLCHGCVNLLAPSCIADGSFTLT